MTEKNIKTTGIVLRQMDYKENDKILTVFSSDLGKISVIAKGCKKQGSGFNSVAQLFCYSDLGLYKGKNMYTLTDGRVKEAFYPLRNDYDTLIYAGEMAKLTLYVIQEELPDPEGLRLLLNTFYFLCKGKHSPLLLYSVYRLKFAQVQGMIPDSDSLKELAYNSGTGMALSHILESEMEQLFNFNVSDQVAGELDNIAKIVINEFMKGV